MGDMGSAQGSAQAKNLPMNSTSQLLGALVPSASLAVVMLSAFLLIRKKFPDVYDPKRRRAKLLASDEATRRARDSFDTDGVRRRNAIVSPFLPPEPPSSLPGWLHMLWTLPDERVLVLVGADAYMYLRFLRMGLTISIPLLVIGWGVLAPVNAMGSPRSADLPQLERFSLANVQAGSSLLWAPLAASYLFTLIVLRWLHRETTVFVDLRQRYLTSPTAQAHSLLLRDLPPCSNKPKPNAQNTQTPTSSPPDVLDQVRGRLLALVLLSGGDGSGSTTRGESEVLGLHVVSRDRRAKFSALQQRKDGAITHLCRAYDVLESVGERPTHLEPPLLKTLRPWDAKSRRRLFRRERVDSLESLSEKVRRLNARLAGAKIRPRPSHSSPHPRLQRGDSARSAGSLRSPTSVTGQQHQQQEGATQSQRSQPSKWQAVWEGDSHSERKKPEADAALLTMNSPLQATALRRVPWQSASVGVLTTSEAPAPRDVIWANLGHSAWTRWLCTALVGLLVLLVILAYTIPVGFIASLANLRELAHTGGLEWLGPVLSLEPAATSLLEGFLPPLLLSLFFSLVPPLMRYLSQLQLLPSYSAAESSAITKLYAFSVLDVFLAYTIAGSLFSKLEQLTRLAGHPVEIVSLLATTMPAQSTFFTTYIIIGTLSQLPSELLRIGALVMSGVMKGCVMRRRGLWDDLELMHNTLGLHYMYPFPLLVLLLGLSYAVLAPLVLLFMTLYFLLAYPVWLHQLLYVYQPSSHTGASQWPAVYRCNICSLVVHQLLLAGVLGLKQAPIQAALIVPLLVATLAYATLFYKSFASLSQSPSLESLLQQQQKESNGVRKDRPMSRWLFGGPLRAGEEEVKEDAQTEQKDDMHLPAQGGGGPGYGSVGVGSSQEASLAAGRREALAKAYDPWPDKGGVGEAEQAHHAMSHDKAQPLLEPYGAIMEGCYWDADRHEIVRIFTQPLQRSILHDWLAALTGEQQHGDKKGEPAGQTGEMQGGKGEWKEGKATAGQDEWDEIQLTV